MTLKEIRPPEEVPDFLQVQAGWLEEHGANDAGVSYSMRRHRTKDGREIYVDVTCRPFRLDGRAARIALVTDVTERKRVEAIEAERAALRETVAAMEQVLGVVGHELRTPLAGLRAISELVLAQEAGTGPETRPLLQCLHDEVVQMSDTVETLLEAARLNSGRATWNWTRFAVGRVCLEAIDGLRSLMAPAGGAMVSLQVDVDPSTEMLGDAAAVRRLLANLLSNAHEHTARGFIRVSVHEERDAAGGWVRMRVADTGTGIPPDVLARLGQAFALSSGVVGISHVGGTGLGLAICQGIADAHGGTMSVESVVGEGTAVTIRLRSDLPGPVAAAPRSRAPERPRAA
jgi:signal transduction histidine kinase